MIRRVLALVATALMLTTWAVPATARPVNAVYPTLTDITYAWTDADSTGTCSTTTVGLLSAPVTNTTRVSARWSEMAISPQGEVWTYTMWLPTPPVGATQVGPWTLGACSTDGARYVSVRIELFRGTTVGRKAVPYTSLTKQLVPGYVCTAR